MNFRKLAGLRGLSRHPAPNRIALTSNNIISARLPIYFALTVGTTGGETEVVNRKSKVLNTMCIIRQK